TITATIAGAISMLAQFGLFFGGHRDNNSGPGMIGTLAMVILAPIAAMIVQMAISRTREYAADELGAHTTGQPHALASALAKISDAAQAIQNPPPHPTPRTSSRSLRCRAMGWTPVPGPSLRPRPASPRWGDGRRRSVPADPACGRAAPPIRDLRQVLGAIRAAAVKIAALGDDARARSLR